MKVKSQSEVAQSCVTLSDPIDCSLPGSSTHGIFQARVLRWVAIFFSSKCLDFVKDDLFQLWLFSKELLEYGPLLLDSDCSWVLFESRECLSQPPHLVGLKLQPLLSSTVLLLKSFLTPLAFQLLFSAGFIETAFCAALELAVLQGKIIQRLFRLTSLMLTLS